MGALEEWIAEMFLVHSLNLLRFSSGTQEKIMLLMAAMSKELTAKLNEGEISTYGKQRLGALLRESNAVISSHYTGMQAEMTRNLTGMVRIEADYTAKVLTQALKIELGAKLPPATYLEKLVGDTLIKGAPSADWWKRQALDTQFRFASQVRLGAAQGETTSQIVSRVLGKSAKAADSLADKPALPATPPMPDPKVSPPSSKLGSAAPDAGAGPKGKAPAAPGASGSPSAPPTGPTAKPGSPAADSAAKPPAAKGPTPAPDPVAPGEQGIRQAIIELYAGSSGILMNLPFDTISGNAMKYNREASLPGVGFRGVNEAYTASTGILNPITESLVIAGGDLDVDKFIIDTMGAQQRSVHEAMKVRALSLAWTQKFIKGDSQSDPREFDGLQVRITGGQMIAAGSTAGGTALSLSKLDEAIDQTLNPTHLVMSKAMRRRLTQAARNTSVGGFLTYGVDAFGKPVEMYNGLPFIVVDLDHLGNPILPFTEAATSGTATATSIYVVSLGENGVLKRYIRLSTLVAGTIATGINFSAFLAKR